MTFWLLFALIYVVLIVPIYIVVDRFAGDRLRRVVRDRRERR